MHGARSKELRESAKEKKMCKTNKEKKLETIKEKVIALFNVEESTNLFVNPLSVSIADKSTCLKSKKWVEECEIPSSSDKGSSWT